MVQLRLDVLEGPGTRPAREKAMASESTKRVATIPRQRKGEPSTHRSLCTLRNSLCLFPARIAVDAVVSPAVEQIVHFNLARRARSRRTGPDDDGSAELFDLCRSSDFQGHFRVPVWRFRRKR